MCDSCFTKKNINENKCSKCVDYILELMDSKRARIFDVDGKAARLLKVDYKVARIFEVDEVDED